MLNYSFTERALRDIAGARAWYEKQEPELGNRFVDDVLAAIRVARERPMSCPIVRNGCHGILCKRFPYRIYFDVRGDHIEIAAVYHTARDPDAWDEPDRQ